MKQFFKKTVVFVYFSKGSQTSKVSLEEKIKHESLVHELFLWILESNTAQKAWINLPSQPEVAIMRNKDIYGPLGSVSSG